MRKYNMYLVISGLLLLSVFFIGLTSFFLLGVFQLAVGIYLLVKIKAYPQWARKGIRNFWIIFISCISALLLGFVWSSLAGYSMRLWLVFTPLFITICQYRLVFRMAGLRRRQLEKRAFLKIYSR